MHRLLPLGTKWAQLGDGCAETDTHGSCARVFDHKGWWNISSDTRFTTRDYQASKFLVQLTCFLRAIEPRETTSRAFNHSELDTA